MGKKKKGKKKTSMKRKASIAAQTALAFFPELRAVGDTLSVGGGDFTRFPVYWVDNRLGYNYEADSFNVDKLLVNNAISIGGPMLIRWAMKGVK